MKKGLKMLLAMALVASVFAVGFAGNAAAYDHHKKSADSQHSAQWASSHVDQEQYVAQGNANSQEDSYAISAAVGWNGGEAESGDAYSVQASYQNNDNTQAAWSGAGNWNEQEN